MAHRVFGLFTKSVALIADQGNDHAVEVEEEHQEVEAKLDERFLKYEFESAIARQIVNQENRPSCAHSACGKSRSHLGDAGYRRSYNSKETQVSLTLGVREGLAPGELPTYFFALNATRGRFSTMASQYPLITKRKVRKAWTAASGMI
jgi:hypothetical protein